MNQEGRISTERQGHVFLIGLDRSAKRNAFDRAMLNALGLAYAELEHDHELRCGVLFAHGEHFTGGLELTQFASSLGHFEYPEVPLIHLAYKDHASQNLSSPLCKVYVSPSVLNSCSQQISVLPHPMHALLKSKSSEASSPLEAPLFDSHAKSGGATRCVIC